MAVENITDIHKESYESVLHQIDKEFENQRSIKSDLKKINNKIIATHIVSRHDLAKDHILYADVKIFSSILEILQLYVETCIQNVDVEYDSKQDLYVVELYLSQLFEDHTLTQKWLINVQISSDNSTVNKSINLKNNMHNPIIIIIPFEQSIAESMVNVNIVWPNLNYWPILKLDPIVIDVSYHFRTYSTEKRKENKIQKLLMHYNKDISEENLNSYNIAAQISMQQFHELLLKHSYHRLNIRKSSTSQSEHNKCETFQLTVDDKSMITIEYDPCKYEIKLIANSSVLYFLKEYFYKELLSLNPGMKPKSMDANFKTFKTDLETDLLDTDQLKSIFDGLR